MTVNVYVDVDGVLNAVSAQTPEDWGWPDEREEKVMGFLIRYSPTLIAELNGIAANTQVQAYWLTTWLDHAPSKLCGPLGINGQDWPVVGKEEYASEAHNGSLAGWWKYDAIRAHVEVTKPSGVVWLDDDLKVVPQAIEWVEQYGDMLAISPNVYLGLTSTHMQWVREYVDEMTDVRGFRL